MQVNVSLTSKCHDKRFPQGTLSLFTFFVYYFKKNYTAGTMIHIYNIPLAFRTVRLLFCDTTLSGRNLHWERVCYFGVLGCHYRKSKLGHKLNTPLFTGWDYIYFLILMAKPQVVFFLPDPCYRVYISFCFTKHKTKMSFYTSRVYRFKPSLLRSKSIRIQNGKKTAALRTTVALHSESFTLKSWLHRSQWQKSKWH